MQPLTRGPEADETIRSQDYDHACDHDICTATPRPSATVLTAAAPSSALELCGCIQRAVRATQGRHGVQVHQQLLRRGLHSGLDGLDAADHFLSKGAVRTRLRHRVLRRSDARRVRCSSELEL